MGAFGEALRSRRRAAGLTQEELAERAGLSPRSISGLERDEGGTPRRDTVALLVQALDLTGPDRAAFEATVVRRRPPLRLVAASARPPAQEGAESPNLPRALTSFVGREGALAELGPILASAPLVTLLGAGGIGKTRLALELAQQHAKADADRVVLVELAELTDPSLVANAVATAVGLRDVHPRNITGLLVEHLRTRQLLLVIDNCEHLVDACAELLSTLLRACPGLHVLATSREPLAIPGETVWNMRPLRLPDPQAPLSAQHIGGVAAVRLFVERAQAVDPTFSLTDANAAAIARVCIALDGIPLALELAAASTRLLGVERLLERLDLPRPNRVGSPRHRSIRATIDWSHDLLSEREKQLLRRLSVFAGGWTLDLAEEVCSGGGITRSDVLELLAQLVDKSMVVVDLTGAEARYRLLEPIRQYGSERLENSGEAASYRARHAAAVLRVPKPSDGDDFGTEEIASLQRYEVEAGNLRVALRWALTHNSYEVALRAAAALFRFWERRGHLQEGCAWLEEALAGIGDAPSRYRGPALNALAFLYWRIGDVERAQSIAWRALRVNRERGSPLGLAWALGNFGAIAHLRGEPGAGVACLEESVALAREAGYAPFLSVALAFLGRALLRANGPSDGRVGMVLEESRALAEAAQARYALGHALTTIGDLHWRRKEVTCAISHWQRALEVRSHIADRRGIADSLERLAWALAATRRLESAAWLFGAADAQRGLVGFELDHAEQAEHAALVAQTRTHLGDCFRSTWTAGHSSSKRESLERALDLTTGECDAFQGALLTQIA